MKRLVWLLLAVFCAVLTPVRPVDGVQAPAAKCDCCDNAGDCGMPGCLPPLASAPSLPALAVSLPAALKLEAKRQAPNPRLFRDRFYRQFVSAPARELPSLRATPAVAPAATAPVYLAQCSLLI